MRKKKLRYSVIILIALLLALIWYNWYREHLFSSTRWINDSSSRELMVNDLLNRFELTGLTECEVIYLLGEEDQKGSQQSTFKGDSHFYPPESTLVYFIGVDYVEERWLIVSLESGVVDGISIGVT